MTPTQVDIGRNQHGNGRPAWLAPAPAASLRRVDHARGKTTPVNWAGRSEAEQFDLVKKYYVRSSWGEFKYDGSWWRKKPGSTVVVARPTTSPHEPGNAVDTDEWTEDGFVALMAEHGWIRTLKSEPWHFVYFAHLDQHRNDPAPSGGATTGGNAAPQEDSMTTLMVKANVNIYTLDRGQIKLNDDINVVKRALAAGIPQVDCTGTVAQQNDQFAGWLDFYGIPRNVVAHGQGWVLNPETGKHEKNGMWNWERVNKALLAQLLAKK